MHRAPAGAKDQASDSSACHGGCGDRVCQTWKGPKNASRGDDAPRQTAHPEHERLAVLRGSQQGWLDAAGETHERIYNVAWSGNRRLRGNGLLPSVGSTVRGAEYNNSIGAPSLTTFWADPDFDSAQRAFYYVRVLEIPTPTWLAYDLVAFGPRELPAGAMLVHQERAYGSPIWYSPS